MGTVITAAILGVVSIAVLGLSNLSLAIVIALTFGSVTIGKIVENRINAKDEKTYQAPGRPPPSGRKP